MSPRPELLFSADGFFTDWGASVTAWKNSDGVLLEPVASWAAAAAIAASAASLLFAFIADKRALVSCVVAFAVDDDWAPLPLTPSGKRHAVSV